MSEKSFDVICNDHRDGIQNIHNQIVDLIEDSKNGDYPVNSDDSSTNRQGEVIAQLTLARRHLEDARMRLGKAIQYHGDGVSKYDHNA